MIVDPDNTPPTVTFSNAPAVISGTDPFTVTVTFSEDVANFDDPATDLSIANGTATQITPISATEYVVTIEPTGGGDVGITVLDAAAQDLAGNDNQPASLTLASTIVEDTQEAIASFMLGRANSLASNQPGLTRFLQGDGCGAFTANATEGAAALNGCVSMGDAWAEITGAWSGDDSYVLGSFGAHRFLNPNLLVGGMLQFDRAEDSANNITGTGWMAGPYFVAKTPDQPLFVEGRLLYGQTENEISPLGADSDTFDTERRLVQLRATGEYQVQNATLMPLLDFTYTDDTQQAYVDSLGNAIPEQKVALSQLTAGLNFSTPIAVQAGDLTLTGGLSGIYSTTRGGSADYEGTRGRAELGAQYGFAAGGTLTASVFYDGLGSDYEAYGARIGFNFAF